MSDELDFSVWPPQPGPPELTLEPGWPLRPRRRPWRVVYWVTFGLLCAAVVGLFVGYFLTFKAAVMLSSDMAPTIPAGSTVQYQPGAGDIVRGDVVMIQSPDGLVARRVIGLPGDRVMCCNSDGWMEVDGQALIEYYIPYDAPPSQPFTVTVGPGQMWVMADNRAAATDSRNWGPLPMTDIVGRVIEVSGPDGRILLKTPQTFTSVGLAPADNRVPLSFVLFGAALAAVVAAIGLGTFGIIKSALRRRRNRRLRDAFPAAHQVGPGRGFN